MNTKYIYSILIGLVSIFIQAQQTQINIEAQNGQTYYNVISDVFAQNNTDRIPYGVLYDRVMGWSELVQWNNGNETRFSHLKQAWKDLEKSKNNPSDTYKNLNYKVCFQKSKGKLPLLSIGYQFGYIDSLAVQDGRMRVENNRLIDNGGASPYLTKKVVFAGLATKKVTSNTNYTLMTNSSFRLSNFTNETITGFTIKNTHTGQSYNLSANGSISIRFNGSGIQSLKITTHTTKGNYINYQKIKVQGAYANRSTNKIDADKHYLLTSSIPFKGYDESTATISYADYHIFYHYPPGSSYSQKILKKPIVILDGFDPIDKRNYKEIYNDKLAYDNQNFGEKLRHKGYDVVILNFPVTGTRANEEDKTNVDIPLVNGTIIRDGGTDYIERNAFLLVKLIQILNAKLQSNGYGNEKLVIVGPSMGGQISRYALAYMEKHGLNHNTRLWVSFDSPHLGANIPLALQKDLHFFGYTGEQEEAKEAYDQKLHSIAARQMLIEQLNDDGSAYPNTGINGTASFHKKYYANLRNNGLPGSNGWPQNLRKIALVNGAGNGLKTNQERATFLTLDARTIFNIKIIEIANRFLSKTGQSLEYFKGKIPVKKWLFFYNFITFTGHMTNINSRGSMDIVQGGVTNSQKLIKDQFETALGEMGAIKTQDWSIKNNHCFIPTVSALGFKNSNFNWNNRIDNRDLVQTGEIPFDNYYIPAYNQEHVSLTEKSALWFLNQLNGNYYNWVEKTNLEGSDTICYKETYIIDNPPPNTQFTWQTSLNLQIISSTNSSVTVKKTGNGSGYIKAIYDGIELKKQVLVGTPNLTAIINIDFEEKDLSLCEVEICNTPYFMVGNDIILVDKENNDVIEFQFQPISNNFEYTLNDELLWIKPYKVGRIDFKIRGKNSCGWGEWKSLSIWVKECDDYKPFSIYPNPASDNVTLKLEESIQKKMFRTSDTYQVVIYNMSGYKVRSVTGRGQEVQISLRGLFSGIYSVHLIKDGKVYKKKLVVK